MSESGDRPGAAVGNPSQDPAVLFEHLWQRGRQPDVQEFLRSAGQLTPAQVVSVLCIDQWKRWQLGERVPAETHLQMHPALKDTDEAVDLIFGEFLLREELDESPTIEEFLGRFPDYAAKLKKQFDFHSAIESGSVLNSVSVKPETHALAPAKTEEAVVAAVKKPPPAPGPAGQPVIPGYEVLSELGRGGMGHVFKARHQRLKRIVALKVIRQERLSQDPEVVRRFEREARAAAQLSHPNVVIVYDADRVEGNYFIAMEYVEGTDLHEYVKESGPLSVDLACDFIRQACLGLNHAFERGMVHRDIKPSNLLVTTPKPTKGLSGFHALPILPGKKPVDAGGSAEKANQGAKEPATKAPPVKSLGLSSLGIGPASVVKILDMGLALVPHSGDSESSQWTKEGTLMGTPDYISPEQAVNSHDVDIRADLYSLGCTLYYLLCGKPPFGDHPLIQKLMMHQVAEATPIEQLRPEVPLKVRAILKKLLAKQREQRYQTPLELADALAALKASDLPASKGAPEASALAEASRANAIPTKAAPPAVPKPVAPPAAKPAATAADIAMKWPSAKPPPSTPKDEENLEKAKKICVLEGHRGWVTSVAFAPDRGTLVSGGVDGALRLWDLAGSEPKDREVARAHASDVTALAFAADNKIASGAGALDGVVWLWDVSGAKPRQIAPLRVGDVAIDCLAFSPDSHLLAAGGTDKHVRLWDVSTAEPQARVVLKGHTDFVKTMAFSHDGNLLASAGKDGSARVWNLSRYWSKEQAVLEGRWGQVQTISFAHDNRALAFGSLDQTVRVCDVRESTIRERAVLRGHIGVVRLVQYNSDGTLLSVCDGGRIILWDPDEGKQLREWLLPRGKVYSMTLTHDGRYLATGNSDGAVVLYRLYPKRDAETDASKTPTPIAPAQ